MLSRASLKLRAALIFAAVFGIVFVAGFVLFAWSSLSTGGERHHAGPTIVLSIASAEVRLGANAVEVPPDGRLARLARANPALWLLVHDGVRTHAFGAVPDAARRLFDGFGGALVTGRFHVPGVPRPLADASVERVGDTTLAAGGIDPATITFADAFDYIASEGLLLVLLALGAVGLTAMLVALPLLTAALKPVSADAAAIGQATPHHRIREQGVPQELLPLVRSFNAALERLSDELGRRRRFAVDVAHELRTPLAVMALQLEALPPGDARTELARVLERMSRMVGQMLDVERLGLQDAQWSRLDLAALARDVVADLAPLALASGYELSLQAPAGAVDVQGDGHALARAIANLVGNAIAHGGGRGDIQVLVADDGSVEVLDDGDGVPAAVRENLFEPFFRARHDRDGCGMGLHLAREIVRAHGGEVALLPSARGARFRLGLPPAGQAQGSRQAP